MTALAGGVLAIASAALAGSATQSDQTGVYAAAETTAVADSINVGADQLAANDAVQAYPEFPLVDLDGIFLHRGDEALLDAEPTPGHAWIGAGRFDSPCTVCPTAGQLPGTVTDGEGPATSNTSGDDTGNYDDPNSGCDEAGGTFKATPIIIDQLAGPGDPSGTFNGADFNFPLQVFGQTGEYQIRVETSPGSGAFQNETVVDRDAYLISLPDAGIQFYQFTLFANEGVDAAIAANATDPDGDEIPNTLLPIDCNADIFGFGPFDPNEPTGGYIWNNGGPEDEFRDFDSEQPCAVDSTITFWGVGDVLLVIQANLDDSDPDVPTTSPYHFEIDVLTVGLGACCVEDVQPDPANPGEDIISSICIPQTQDDCLAGDGVFYGPGVDCADVTCCDPLTAPMPGDATFVVTESEVTCDDPSFDGAAGGSSSFECLFPGQASASGDFLGDIQRGENGLYYGAYGSSNDFGTSSTGDLITDYDFVRWNVDNTTPMSPPDYNLEILGFESPWHTIHVRDPDAFRGTFSCRSWVFTEIAEFGFTGGAGYADPAPSCLADDLPDPVTLTRDTISDFGWLIISDQNFNPAGDGWVQPACGTNYLVGVSVVDAAAVGACCVDGVCFDNVPQADCEGGTGTVPESGTFFADLTCAEPDVADLCCIPCTMPDTALDDSCASYDNTLAGDTFNDGCSQGQGRYSVLTGNNNTWCGRSGIYTQSQTGTEDVFREDWDWYSFTLAQDSRVTFTVQGNYAIEAYIRPFLGLGVPCPFIPADANDGSGDLLNVPGLEFATGIPCTDVVVTACLPAGTHSIATRPTAGVFGGATLIDFGECGDRVYTANLLIEPGQCTTGACCIDGMASDLPEIVCLNAGGAYLGDDTTAATSTCCDLSAGLDFVLENEEDCSDFDPTVPGAELFEDVSDGCFAGRLCPTSQILTDLPATAFGTIGVYAVGELNEATTFTRDIDWWGFELAETSDVEVTITANFPPRLRSITNFGTCDNTGADLLITPDTVDDPDSTVITESLPCETYTVTLEGLEAGSHFLEVGPSLFLGVAQVPCGAEYNLSVSTVVVPTGPCPGDGNGDLEVDLDDFSALAVAFGQVVTPGTGVDWSGNGVVDLDDFSVLAVNFGNCYDAQCNVIPCP